MNIFELLWFSIFLGGGSYLGYRLAGLGGAIAGVIAGFFFQLCILRFLDPYPDDEPICECGYSGQPRFSPETHDTEGHVDRCVECGALYFMRKGTTWTRISVDGSTKLFMQRRFRGRWQPVNSDLE